MSAYAWVVTSPATCTWPVVIIVSTATRLCASCARSASRMPSLIASAILSGCPSVTDSEVKRRRGTLLPTGELTQQLRASLAATRPDVSVDLLTYFRRSGRSGQARRDQRPDCVRQVVLRAERHI